ncbi:methyltransferase [Beijerinckia sp. L45]|uniref:methyltransferase n=1 Tax=Beijerinckia sp. L45 TaxID=1641855 RepID=UPI0034CD621F
MTINTGTPDYIFNLGMGFWASKTLLSAVEIGVFDVLAVAPANLGSLRKQLSLHDRSAQDFLDTLVALKVLERDNGIYRNAPDADLFLDKAKATYIGGPLQMANSRLYGFWGSLTEALRTGEPQNETKADKDHFATIYANPEHLRRFLATFTALSASAAQVIATTFPWKDYASFVDVGTAQGIVPVTLQHAQKHLKGIGFDLPPVQPAFEEFVMHHGLAEKLRFQAGSFFTDAIPNADVVIMGHVLHDWDLAQRKLLLGKAFAALPEGGALIVYDAMIDDDRRENTFALLMSLNMLIETKGGSDYTAADCESWIREAGFSAVRRQSAGGPDTMMIGIK